MHRDTILYALLSISLLSAVSSVLLGSLPMAALGALSAMVVALLYRAWYIIEALMFRHTSIVQLFNGYEMRGSRRAAVARDGAGYSAVAAVRLDSTAGSLDRERLETVISRMGFPFKIVLCVNPMDKAKLVEELRTRRSMKELELDRLMAAHPRKAGRTTMAKREVELLDNEVKKVTAGGQPLVLRHYAMASAFADSESSAVELAVSRVAELSSSVAALIGASQSVVEGEELVSILRLDAGLVA